MRQDIPLTSLLVDTENPRLEVQPGHRDAVRELFKSDTKKMVRLTEDIAEHGTLNPLEKIGVSESSEHIGRYIVREGNRRVAAVLVLHNPDLIKGVLTPVMEKKVRTLSTKYLKSQPVDTVECEVLPNEELKHWITLRHTGENQGAGIVEWGPTEKSRYLERTGAGKSIEMQFLDRYLEHTRGDQLEARRIKKLPLSSFKRLLESAPVRRKLGISVDNKGWASSAYAPEEMFKWLRRMIHDLTSPNFKVRNIYTTKDMVNYIDSFAAHELPDSKKALGQPIPVEPVGTVQPKQASRQRKKSKHKKWSIREAGIQCTHSRLSDILDELESLSWDKANIHAVMLRVFLELSVDDFLERHHLHVPPDRGNTASLRLRTISACNHAEKQGWLDRKQAGAIRKVAGSTSLGSAKTLSDFVHNQHLHPSPKDVETTWKNLAAFLAVVHAN